MNSTWTTRAEAGRGIGSVSRRRGDSSTRSRSTGQTPAWSSPRLAAGTAGGALALYGAFRRGLPGVAAAVIGFGLLGGALGAGGLRWMLGIEPKRTEDIRKTMTIRAPADRIFDFWTKYNNAPSFMRNARTTRMTGNGRSRWVIIGPSGAPIGWDAKLVSQRPSKLLSWQTEKDAAVRHAGTMRFIDNGDRTTTVALRMTYHPPADGDHGGRGLPDIATLLDEDLMRMKVAIESGIVPVEDRQASKTKESPISLQAS